MDFIKLFADYKIAHNSDGLKRGWVNVQCPWCPDKNQNGGFNVRADYFYCWRCGSHDFKKTLSRLLSTPVEIIKDLIPEYETRYRIGISHNEKKTSKIKTLELPGNDFTDIERQYLLKRKYNPKHLAEKYKIVGGGISGDWRYRIIIPLFFQNRLVSWTARSILSEKILKQTGQPRYKQLAIEKSIVDPKTIFYNLDNCKTSRLILMEGVFDVVRMGDNFACSFGTEITHTQIRFLKKNYSWVGILFDAEKGAQAKARKFALQLSALGMSVEVIDAFGDFGKKDAGELSPRQAAKLRGELGF